MIRLSYQSPLRGERTLASDKSVVRFGRGPECELRVEGSTDARVALYHGEVVLEGGTYYVVETLGRHGVWVQGKRVGRFPVHGGERFRLGSPEGPEIRVVEVSHRPDGPEPSEERTLFVEPGVVQRLQARADRSGAQTPPPPPVPDLPRPPPHPPRRAAPVMPALALVPPEREEDTSSTRLTQAPQRAMLQRLKLLGRPQEEVMQWVSRAQREIARAREKAYGGSSGHTAFIMARALAGIRATADGHARRWKRVLLGVLLAGGLVVAALSLVIWVQNRRINHLVTEKVTLDSQIQAVYAQMATETDSQRLEALEGRLETLMGSASETLTRVTHASAARARELERPQDPLDQDIRKILASFHAETYAVPPIFKQALKRQIADLRANRGLANAYARKQRYWPVIQRALAKKQLPEELGYIAYTESAFDPSAVNGRSKAAGMWQLMEDVARPCGISVRAPDLRLDPARSSDAAACYLSKLLIEFGEESFMLALASYNRGENGVRRALHTVAKEPGGYRKRDFWHLYRLKLLPEETREYVPKVLAAAIVFGHPDRYGLPDAD